MQVLCTFTQDISTATGSSTSLVFPMSQRRSLCDLSESFSCPVLKGLSGVQTVGKLSWFKFGGLELGGLKLEVLISRALGTLAFVGLFLP